jgi:hypothetical protein
MLNREENSSKSMNIYELIFTFVSGLLNKLNLVRTNNLWKSWSRIRKIGKIKLRWLYTLKSFYWLHIFMIYLIIYKTLFIEKESERTLQVSSTFILTTINLIYWLFCNSCLFNACNSCLNKYVVYSILKPNLEIDFSKWNRNNNIKLKL